MTRDPHHEPENSTVDNWMGQEVNKDAELADRLIEENNGDEAAAEQEFERRSAGAQPGPGEVKRAKGDGYA